MYKIGANLIITPDRTLLKQSYLVLDQDQVIVDVVNTHGEMQEIAGLAFYNGVLFPGLIVGTNRMDANGFNSRNSQMRIWFQRGYQAVGEGFSERSSPLALLQNKNHSIIEQIHKYTAIAALHYEMENLGSFAKGKTPGVILLEGYNIKKKTLMSNATVKRLL